MKNIEFMKVHEQASVVVVGASNRKSQSFTEENLRKTRCAGVILTLWYFMMNINITNGRQNIV